MEETKPQEPSTSASQVPEQSTETSPSSKEHSSEEEEDEEMETQSEGYQRPSGLLFIFQTSVLNWRIN